MIQGTAEHQGRLFIWLVTVYADLCSVYDVLTSSLSITASSFLMNTIPSVSIHIGCHSLPLLLPFEEAPLTLKAQKLVTLSLFRSFFVISSGGRVLQRMLLCLVMARRQWKWSLYSFTTKPPLLPCSPPSATQQS